MYPVPGWVAEARGSAGRVGPRSSRCRGSGPCRRALARAAHDLHLRAWPGRAHADRVSAQALSGRGRGARGGAALPGGRLLQDGGAVTDLVTLTIDGREVAVPRGTTIFDAARLNGIPIPTLCHQQNQTPVGVCRVCVVDVGARVYAASCIR